MKRALIAFICLCVPATAQSQNRQWEVEGYAGVLAAQPASAGSITIPPPGAPLVTSTPTFPARATSSWFFGDGATLLNGVLQDFQRPARIAPLDPAFGPLRSAHPAAFGARVRRRLNAHVSLEIAVDALGGSPIRTRDVTDAVAATRDSFAPAFADLFASGPFSRTVIFAQGETDEGDFRETAFTAAFNRDVGRLGGLQPYFTVGAGVVAASGTPPSATLQGHYFTTILGEVPIDEIDRVSIRFTRSTSAVAVLGGGVRHDFSDAWGLRIDARLLVGPDTTRVHLDAQPTVARGTPAGFIESFTNPAIQFSNDPATGRRSSLSGAALQNVEVFNGGVLARTVISVAVARRF
ncbi:MAG TPA: hypothetical protein VKE51_41565 [Vicinamibacterales bacterium]|nr:hypothetical protein [Vicinamibacterales bacterium]